MMPNMYHAEDKLMIFTDGASRGNPGPGGWGAVIIHMGLSEIIELGGNKGMTTNNEMELTALVAAFSYAKGNTSPVHVYSDSAYAIEGITKWVLGWKKNGWLTKGKDPVKNRPQWEELHNLIESRKNAGIISWHHVPAHSGIPGNERVDAIATGFAESKHVPLYRGNLATYMDRNIIDVSMIEAKRKEKQEATAASSGKAFSYLSVVDGELERHEEWGECRKRVEGRNAAFRKALSKEHEDKIIAEWKEKKILA